MNLLNIKLEIMIISNKSKITNKQNQCRIHLGSHLPRKINFPNKLVLRKEIEV